MEDQALKVTGGERSGAKEEDRFSERGRGRGNFKGRGRGRGRAINKAIVECYRCHKLGHFQYECPSYAHYADYAKLDNDQEMLLMSYVETQNSKREEVSYAHYAEHLELDKDQEMLLMSYIETQNSKREEVWFLDSGCSNHMSGDKQWFIELDQSFRHLVKLGNDSKMAVMGERKCQNMC